MPMRLLLAALLLAALPAPPAHAQSTITEGMTPEQVSAAFGVPATVRTAGDWSYWYYHNGCPRRCGSDDVVFFREQRVVAAVLRTSARRFSGPAAHRALEAASDLPDREAAGVYLPAAAPVRVGGVRVESAPAEVIVVREGAVTGSDLAVPADSAIPADSAAAPPLGEAESSVDRAHQRNLERAAERESAVDRARRLRDERRP